MASCSGRVPWAYFHLLNLLQFFVLGLFALGIVGYAYWWITLAAHAMVTLILLGLRELYATRRGSSNPQPADRSSICYDSPVGASPRNEQRRLDG